MLEIGKTYEVDGGKYNEGCYKVLFDRMGFDGRYYGTLHTKGVGDRACGVNPETLEIYAHNLSGTWKVIVKEEKKLLELKIGTKYTAIGYVNNNNNAIVTPVHKMKCGRFIGAIEIDEIERACQIYNDNSVSVIRLGESYKIKEEYKEPIKLSGWVNVYGPSSCGGTTPTSNLYATKELADQNSPFGRIACVYVSGQENE